MIGRLSIIDRRDQLFRLKRGFFLELIWIFRDNASRNVLHRLRVLSCNINHLILDDDT